MKIRKINRNLVTIIIMFVCFTADMCYSQKDKDCKTQIYNYFTQRNDSIIFDIGSVFLMSSDSISLIGNIYCIKTDTVINQKEVYFKKKLLFKYETKNGKVNGIGYCFYPFLEKVAIQGQFKNEKLHGFVITQDENGKIIECMKFKNGVYKRHLFHFESDNSKKSLRMISKNRSKNPLRNDELIVR